MGHIPTLRLGVAPGRPRTLISVVRPGFLSGPFGGTQPTGQASAWVEDDFAVVAFWDPTNTGLAETTLVGFNPFTGEEHFRVDLAPATTHFFGTAWAELEFIKLSSTKCLLLGSRNFSSQSNFFGGMNVFIIDRTGIVSRSPDLSIYGEIYGSEFYDYQIKMCDVDATWLYIGNQVNTFWGWKINYHTWEFVKVDFPQGPFDGEIFQGLLQGWIGVGGPYGIVGFGADGRLYDVDSNFIVDLLPPDAHPYGGPAPGGVPGGISMISGGWGQYEDRIVMASWTEVGSNFDRTYVGWDMTSTPPKMVGTPIAEMTYFAYPNATNPDTNNWGDRETHFDWKRHHIWHAGEYLPFSHQKDHYYWFVVRADGKHGSTRYVGTRFAYPIDRMFLDGHSINAYTVMMGTFTNTTMRNGKALVITQMGCEARLPSRDNDAWSQYVMAYAVYTPPDVAVTSPTRQPVNFW